MGSVVALLGVSFSEFMDFFAEFTDFVDVIIWPLVVLAVLWFLASKKGSRLMKPILRRVRKISGGGFALELSEESARATKFDVEGALTEYAAVLDEELGRLAYLYDVRTALANVVEAASLDDSKTRTNKRPRATVHIRDPLYEGVLYQLVDYYPGGSGARRRYSTRFGILGRAWRLGRTQESGRVPTERDALIVEWGMTREQAVSAAHDRESFLCMPLHSIEPTVTAECLQVGLQVGALYVDAVPKNALKGVARSLEGSEALAALAAAVAGVDRDIRALGPGIKLLAND